MLIEAEVQLIVMAKVMRMLYQRLIYCQSGARLLKVGQELVTLVKGRL
ncbi:hypothetical protein DVH24_023311 [Malus domestica]|uniref:Uncharacterized protein n=1 Tax=Malus domestica TaxID=3750 RepID=A0A498KLW8_MALDO|nr:hypothetical protein DVH24_023311 [Malus domestica]